MTCLYLRREPTADLDALARASDASLLYWDVVAYSDPGATQPVARWPWFSARKPARRDKRVMIRSNSWSIAWLDESATTGSLLA